MNAPLCPSPGCGTGLENETIGKPALVVGWCPRCQIVVMPGDERTHHDPASHPVDSADRRERYEDGAA